MRRRISFGSEGGVTRPLSHSPTSTPEERGIIIADTKFELGRGDRRGDRARRRSADAGFVALLAARRVRAGKIAAIFDKQFVRDWCAGPGWDKIAPGPALPEDVVGETRARYIEAFERLTDSSFDAGISPIRESVLA